MGLSIGLQLVMLVSSKYLKHTSSIKVQYLPLIELGNLESVIFQVFIYSNMFLINLKWVVRGVRLVQGMRLGLIGITHLKNMSIAPAIVVSILRFTIRIVQNDTVSPSHDTNRLKNLFRP